ncbi:MAG: hypothetical protein IJA52_05460 [Clostridia bacterium]|nr:hypothetical protein [Clostridia bacterium]
MKRIIAYLLATVLSWALLAFPVCAEGEGTVSKYLSLDVFSEDAWKTVEGIDRISKRSAGDSFVMTFASKKDAAKLSVTATLDEADISEYNEIVFEMQVRGEGENYPLTVVLKGNKGSATHQMTVSAEGEKLYVPISDEVGDSLSSINLTIDAKNVPVSYITLLSATADDNYTYAHCKTFFATDILSSNKTEITETNVRLFFEKGEADLTPVWNESFRRGKNVLVWVNLKGISSGSVLCSGRYEEINEESKKSSFVTRDTAPQTLTSDGTFVFVTEGGFDSLSFKFSQIPEGVTHVDVTGCSIIELSEKETTAGSISSCRFDGKKLTVSGTLAADASVRYYGSKILLYSVPVAYASDFDVEEYTPVAQQSFSTRFSVSVSSDRFYAQSLYRVYLDTKDGKIPVGDLSFADCAYSAPPASSAVSSLYGADVGDVFETNASSVIIDLRAGELFEHDQIYSAFLYSYGTNYYFNREYLKALDNSMDFYRSSGIAVYLRLYSDREGYVFEYSADTPSSLSVMCAVSTFLSERYPWISGFIMGPSVNEKKTLMSSDEAESTARLYALLTECAKSKNPSLAVFLPIAKGGADPYLTTALVQYYLAKYSSGNTAIMYEGADMGESDCLFAQKLSQISTMFGNASDGAAVMCRPDIGATVDAVCSSYRVGCKSASSQGLRFCALDVSKISETPGLYDSLKVMLDTENVIASSITELSAKIEPAEFAGIYPVWDLTASYDTSDWVAGGSFSFCESARGKNGKRALISRSTSELSSAGILVGKLDSPLDINGLCAVLELYISCADTETADLSVIFGSGEMRYEYSARVQCNEPVSLQCDIPSSLNGAKTDYAAIIVRGAQDPEIQLSRVYMGDAVSSDEQLVERFSTAAEEEHEPLLYLCVISVVALSVTVFSVLLKKRKRSSKNDEQI